MPDFIPKQINSPSSNSVNLPYTPPKSFYQANKPYIWGIVLAVIIITILAFVVFRPTAAPVVKEANVELVISAPESLASGNDAVYRIEAKNNDDVKLTDLELEVVYPEGFTYISSSPKAENISKSSFKIGAELPQGVKVLLATIKVKTSGDINSEKRLAAKLHYRYSNFNSSFVKEANHSLRLTASDVVLEITGPKETNNSQLVAFTVEYKNNSKESIKSSRIRINYPSGFNFGSSQPSPSLGNNTWNIGDLQSQGSGAITFQGTFNNSQPGESKTLVAEFLTFGGSGDYFVQNTAESVTTITSQPLLVALEDADQSGRSIARPGDTINYDVRFQNNSQVAATGVNIAVSLDSKAVDLSTVQAQGGQLVGNTITWNAAGVPKLETLSPNESGSVRFSVKVKNPATKDSSKNLTLNIAAQIKADQYSTFLPGDKVSLKISSPARLQAEVSYQSGSLPPKVGLQTKYKVTFKLSNSSNDFSGVEVTAFLPSVAGNFNSQSISASEKTNVQFDPATGKLAWKPTDLAAHTGKFSPVKSLEFEVAVNPSAAQVGESPVLVRDIQFKAKDNFTEEQISLKAEDLTTSSVEDEGYSKGRVTQ